MAKRRVKNKQELSSKSGVKKKRVPRKPKKILVERTRNAGKWTEAMFWQAIRSALRSKSRFWVPRMKALEAARRPSQSSNKRLKWEFQCCVCYGWFPQTQVEVHHSIPAGKLNCYDDLPGFVKRLFVEDGWIVNCKPCHKAHHDEEKLNEL